MIGACLRAGALAALAVLPSCLTTGVVYEKVSRAAAATIREGTTTKREVRDRFGDPDAAVTLGEAAGEQWTYVDVELSNEFVGLLPIAVLYQHANVFTTTRFLRLRFRDGVVRAKLYLQHRSLDPLPRPETARQLRE